MFIHFVIVKIKSFCKNFEENFRAFSLFQRQAFDIELLSNLSSRKSFLDPKCNLLNTKRNWRNEQKRQKNQKSGGEMLHGEYLWTRAFCLVQFHLMTRLPVIENSILNENRKFLAKPSIQIAVGFHVDAQMYS